VPKLELRILRTFFGLFLLVLGFYKVLQDLFNIVDKPVYMPYVLATLVVVWNTVEVVKEIRKSNAQVAS